MIENEALKPTNDYVFKRIFGRKENAEITRGLISAIIGREVSKVELNESPILEKDLRDDKLGILDVKAKLEGGQLCDIEMQVAVKKDIEKRIMFYWSKLYFSQIKEGERYKELNKTIVILITKFELESIKEIKKFHTKWKIREEKYSKIILTDVLELHIIELPKLMKQLENKEIDKNDQVALWGAFIMNPERIGEKEMSENSFVKKAKEELTKLQQDEREKYLAEQRLILIRDKHAIEDYGYDKGMKEGLEQGKKEGIEQGKTEKQKEIVLNMHKKKMSLEDICEITNLSKEEVEEIIGKEL